MTEKIPVDLCIDLKSPSGYSAHGRELARALHPLVDLRIEDHKHDKRDVDFSPEDAQLFGHLADKQRPAKVRIQFETPEFFKPREGVINIGITQWETTKIINYDLGGDPRLNWTKQMNRMDGMWTSCAMAANAFVESGVTVPVNVLRGPMDTGLYRPGLEELYIADLNVDAKTEEFIPREKRPIVIGMVAQWTIRKNIPALLVPILSRFDRDEVTILLKTYGSVIDDDGNNERVMAMIQDLRKMVDRESAPRIVLVLSKLTDEEMAQLYASMDIYVNTSRGEGFCMPLVQAMASEVFPVTCGFSAPKDYVHPYRMDGQAAEDGSNGFLVNYTLEPAVGMRFTPWYRYDQDWANIDQADMVAKIRSAIILKREEPSVWNDIRTNARQTVVDTMSHRATGAWALTLIEEALERGVVNAGA